MNRQIGKNWCRSPCRLGMGGGVDFQVARGAANTSLWGPAAAVRSVYTLSSERQKKHVKLLIYYLDLVNSAGNFVSYFKLTQRRNLVKISTTTTH